MIRSRSSRALFAVLSATATVLALLPAAGAQAATGPTGAPVQQGAVVTAATHFDRSLPLRAMVAQSGDGAPQHQAPGAKPIDGSRRAHSGTPGAPSSTTTTAVPAALANFDGIGNGFSGPQGTFTVNAAPPDTNGAVGPNHYVQVVNTDFAVFAKTGSVVYGPVAINTLWSGFGGLCQADNDGDPTVTYDAISDRWVISQFAITGANGTSTPFLECVAVSTGGDPTGSYNRYSFSYSQFPDYPKFSAWPDAYYVTYNMFNAAGTQFQGAEVCALDRTHMLAGQAATQQCFNVGTSYGGLLAASFDGTAQPPSGSSEPVVSLGAVDGQLAYWAFHTDWATPANTTLTGPTTLATAAFTLPCNDTGGTCVPQGGTAQQLDTLGDRLMQRLAYRNFGDHESLVVNHSITAGSSIGVRWYELRRSGSSLSIFQQGTYAPDAAYRWMGSVEQDQAGNIGLGYSISSSSTHPGIRYTGRLASDPAGTMSQGEGAIIDGAGSQMGSNLSRWGDYSGMSIDPSDGCTFWYTTEYIPANGAFNWKTRIASFKLPNCPAAAASDFSISVSPTSGSVNQGGSTTATVSTATTSGSAQTVSLSASGVPTGASASFNPASVTSGGSSTMTVNSGTAAAGTYTITVTGTGTSATHSTSYTLTINTPPPPSDFSISVSPASGSVNQGGSTTATVSTATTSGSAQTVNLSASGVPTGASASFNPASVTSGGSSTMTVNSGTAAAGTYTITVTGTGTSATHSTPYTLTINAPPPADDFSISAAPASATVNQGDSPTSTISTTTTSGSAQTVNLTASGVPSGASASFNPASVTSGGSSTMTVSTGTAAAGTYAITVTGTGTSATHSTTYTLTITADDFSISASPASGSVDPGGSTTSTIATATTSGAAQTVNLSVSGVPAGASASVSPTAVTSGASATLSVSSGTAAAGTYTLTVTGSGTYATHSTTFTLTVNSPGGITNGGFETGDLSGWTAAGTTATSTTAHSGTYSARVGGTSPTNGDSSLAQTFNVPAGMGSLSFWYRVVCPDSVTYDWATATLKDNTAGTTATVLAKTCTNSGAWVQKTATVTAGHSYTLTLVSHDDNYAGDPTYTLYDDVALSAPPPPPPTGITNGGFETGTLSGWTASGTTAVVSGSAHSGTYAARVGGTSPTSGDSSIAQSFTASAGSTSLSFWYRVVCPDTVTYDWAMATLKDNTSGTTTTVLAKTCTNTGSWVQKTAAVTAGHSYTLTLVSHDDNYPGDPTYTLYDDVTLS